MGWAYMNKERREQLSRAQKMLDDASGIISAALDQEQDCIDNMPENLLDSERVQKMELAIDNLESAINSIDEAKESIECASE